MRTSLRMLAARLLSAAVLILLSTSPLWAQDLPKVPKGAWVYLKSPQNGATVKSPVKIEMRAVKIAVDPAGAVKAGSGHHHLVVDDVPPPAGVAVSADATHLHFGKAQTEATLELTPGIHTITAQFADGLHRSYGPQLAYTIIVKVE